MNIEIAYGQNRADRGYKFCRIVYRINGNGRKQRIGEMVMKGYSYKWDLDEKLAGLLEVNGKGINNSPCDIKDAFQESPHVEDVTLNWYRY